MIDILYTNTDEIRSALMLAEEDLPETLFNQDMYERDLARHLDSWLPGHAAHASGSGTPAGRAIASALISYCTYWCAAKVAQTIAVSLPQQVGDGKNTLQRYPDTDAVMTAMLAGMAEARQTILGQLSQPSAIRVSLFGVARLAVDPVTG